MLAECIFKLPCTGTQPAARFRVLTLAVGGQASVVQVLQADCGQIQRLIAAAVAELAGPVQGGSAGTPLDKAQLMEAMHDNHLQHMPKVESCEAALASFCQRCIDDKVCHECHLPRGHLSLHRYTAHLFLCTQPRTNQAIRACWPASPSPLLGIPDCVAYIWTNHVPASHEDGMASTSRYLAAMDVNIDWSMLLNLWV